MPSPRLLLSLLVALFSSAAWAPAVEVTLADLLRDSTSIAIVEIDSAPALRMSGEAWNSKMPKQKAEARLIRTLRGYLPETFQIENQSNSVLTPGQHIAFLRRLKEGEYILSTPGSLRRIRDGQVYWFPKGYIPLEQALADIK